MPTSTFFRHRFLFVTVLALLASSMHAQGRTLSLHTFTATGLDDGPTEKQFRAAANAFAPNTLVSIDPRIGEVQVLSTMPFDLGGFLEMAQQYGVILNTKPQVEGEGPNDQ